MPPGVGWASAPRQARWPAVAPACPYGCEDASGVGVAGSGAMTLAKPRDGVATLPPPPPWQPPPPPPPPPPPTPPLALAAIDDAEQPTIVLATLGRATAAASNGGSSIM